MSDKPKKMNLNSMDISEEKKKKLKELFPEVFNEEHIDFDQLKRVLGEWVEPKQERFGLNWPGKAECMKVLQAPAKGTLKPCKEESINWDTTENLFIEGDNLEILKLLQKAYFGKIKMIYIDPPYNTGKEFIYPDKYSEGLDTYLRYTGQKDSNGHKFSTNTDTNGRFHSRWLNMMYPRLYLAKNLLRDDGVIFISIDDNEQANLKKLCDQIFGEENFIDSIVWNKRVPKNDKGIGNIHEYLLLYVKNHSLNHTFKMDKDGMEELNELRSKLKRAKIPIQESEKEIRKLYEKRKFDRGITLYSNLDDKYELWGKINMSWPNANTFGPKFDVIHPKTKKPVKVPDRGWRWREARFREELDYNNCIELHDGSFKCGRIWFDKDENTQPSSIRYLKDVEYLLLRTILSLKSDGGIKVEALFGGKNIFSYPKPVSLLKTLISSIINNPKDIILDFFAGSASTAHAVMNLNNEDSGNRKFIMVQLPEPCLNKSEAFKAGYKTVADIGKERIRRVIKDIKDKSSNSDSLDLGFKTLKLDKSCFKEWDGNPNISQQMLLKQIEEQVDYIDPKASNEDILYELILKDGLSPTTSINELNILGKTVYSIEKGALLICLDKELTEDFILKLVETEPTPKRVICLDAGFRNNDQLKTNAVHTFKTRAHHKETTIDFLTI